MQSSKLVIKMLDELRGRVDELSDTINKDIGNDKDGTKHKHKT